MTAQIIKALAERYSLDANRVERLPIGEATVNFRVVCTGGDVVFVKQYPASTDIGAERQAIGLSDIAAVNGVPTAQVRRSLAGDLIDAGGECPLSVWSWALGQPPSATPSRAQSGQMGEALGRIHLAFRDLPASSGPAPQVARWMGATAAGVLPVVDQLQSLARGRIEAGKGDAFDHEVVGMLEERRRTLPRLDELLASLPKLSSQIVHGDYSYPNFLFEGDRLTAVLDFSPPSPFLVAYDLGQIAFVPDTVMGDPNWLSAAEALVASYLAANPGVREDDVRFCGRVALLQLLHSLFGVRQHYMAPSAQQAGLDDFWRLRHGTVRRLLGNLAEVDAMLADLVGQRGRSGIIRPWNSSEMLGFPQGAPLPEQGMGKPIVIALYIALMIAVVVGVDILFFRGRFWERLMANAGIVLLFGAFYLRFLWRS